MREVQLIIKNIDSVKDQKEQMKQVIAPHYRAKYEACKQEQAKYQELLAGYLLKEYLGVVSDEQLRYSEKRKPELVSGSPFFSISHSGEYVALAIAEEPVGVDIEKIGRMTDRVARRVFSQKRMEMLEEVKSQGAVRYQEELCLSWTKYEAVIKMTGNGLSESMDKDTLEEHMARAYSSVFPENVPVEDMVGEGTVEEKKKFDCNREKVTYAVSLITESGNQNVMVCWDD